MKTDKLTIGTRGSDLALWQAHYVRDLLRTINIEAELKIIKTQGDRIQHLSFDKMEGKGFFTKEIEAALLDGSVDLAVHSHKDLETTQPQGLRIVAVPERGFVEDLLLIAPHAVDESSPLRIKKDAVIGTSSARRKTQLKFHLPGCSTKDLRGNVPTRIGKLRDGQYDAIVLAKAGLMRLELDVSDLEVVAFDPTRFIPAPAQGALALQMREEDPLGEKLAALTHADHAACVKVERDLLRKLDGGCQLPFGAHCIPVTNGYGLYAAIADGADDAARYGYLEGRDPEALVRDMHAALKKKA